MVILVTMLVTTITILHNLTTNPNIRCPPVAVVILGLTGYGFPIHMPHLNTTPVGA